MSVGVENKDGGCLLAHIPAGRLSPQVLPRAPSPNRPLPHALPHA